ncbi:MAG: L-rhamnose/proton symporter RhaT [Candidatus Hydrogenedentes bacterium]|nr:L-rhamnose/proton symporter RhaT [Candidatus Hydrogenedentota bacterium]
MPAFFRRWQHCSIGHSRRCRYESTTRLLTRKWSGNHLDPNPFLGVGLHATGGFAAGSFYIPFKRVRAWSWESYWLVGGVFSWIVAPWVAALAMVPHLWPVLDHAPISSLFWSYFFGVLWGIGGLTFGLSMRYLGMSLGYALALGFCAAFGTLIPPMFQGEFGALVGSMSGRTVLSGVALCMIGIAICGIAGMRKERELSDEAKTATIKEFNFVKGVWVAVFAGVMSACMAFAIAAGKPIAELAVQKGTPPIWQNTPVFVVVLAGGFTTNCLWCVYLNWSNASARDYLNSATPLLGNYLYSGLAGVTWYLQFLFYGMGTTQMGRFDFSSWTLHMAFIIIFSNLWGLFFREWTGSSRRTLRWMLGGLLLLLASTVVVGYGNKLAAAP